MGYIAKEVPRPSWIEVDVKALKHNMRAVRSLVGPKVEVMAVVKANAYGHGLEAMAFAALESGLDRFGVATMGEAVSLRKAGIGAPILVLGFVPMDQTALAVTYHVAQTVYNYETAKTISDLAMEQHKRATIHIKVDTGMGRLGFLPTEESVEEICRIAKLPGIYMEGLYTHFSCADCADKAYSLMQYDKFLHFAEALAARGVHFPIRHAANSAAVIDLPQTHFDMVRPGMILYGYYPSGDVDRSKIDLVPALSLKAQVALVKRVPSGTALSYGANFVTQHESIIATLPVGYADGYFRAFANRSDVLIHGRRARVVGNVCMDQIMVDVTDIPDVQIGDEAVVIGRQGEDAITPEELAAIAGTINYEVLTALSRRLPREYVEE